MVWKSNLDENEQEFIEDFGAKSAPNKSAGAPAVPQRVPASKKGARGASAAKKGASPTRSKLGDSVSQLGGEAGAVGGMNEMPPAYQPSGDGVGGSGEELAQTLEKVVSQLDIISRTLQVLDQRVGANEESVKVIMGYFGDLRQQRMNDTSMQIKNANMGYTQTQGNVINAYTMGG